MKYSFIIPTYNNKMLLLNTLRVLNRINKKEKDFEVIVSDDGSTDDSQEFINKENYSFKLLFIYTPRNEKSSRARARNIGVKYASGEICIFIDSDIIITENFLHEINRCFSYNSNIFVYSTRIMLSQALSYDEIANLQSQQCEFFDANNINTLEYRHYVFEKISYNSNNDAYNWMQVYGCNLSIFRAHFIAIGGFDENFIEWGLEDQELAYRLIKFGIQPILNSRNAVLHQFHGERNDLYIEESKKNGFNNNINYFLNKHPEAVKLPRKFAYKFMTGQIPVLNTINTKKIIEIIFHDEVEEPGIYKIILDSKDDSSIEVIINDYIEKTNLDLWIHLLGKTSATIRYFPMSKRIMKEILNKFHQVILEKRI